MNIKANEIERKDIKELEDEVAAFQKNDHRGGRATMAIDLSRVKITEVLP